MSRFALLLLLSEILGLAFSGQVLEEEVDTALLRDDQCVSQGGGECGLNALQMMSQKSFDGELLEEMGGDEEELDVEEDDESDIEAAEESELESDRWLKDISLKSKKIFKKALAPLQKPIVAEYQALAVLDKFANYTKEKVENATGKEIHWNKKGVGLMQVNDVVGHGRRRSSKSLPPRARYVNKILIYLEKEMQAVWNMHTIVDRKRWGVGDVITASPYGPHGEHPDAWEANGSFPLSLVRPAESSTATIALPKVKTAKFENKYAIQLQEDYEALVNNIIDAKKKTGQLQNDLTKMDGYADEFISSPSGEYNRIKTQ